MFPSISIFSSESVLHIRWPEYWSFSFSISPSSEYSGLISLRLDWLDFFVIQGTFKSLLQHHSFSLLLSFPYSPTLISIHDYWKNNSTTWTFVGKVMSLLFNTLFRFVTAFLPRSKCFNFMPAVTICSDFGAQENKVCPCFHCFPIYLP